MHEVLISVILLGGAQGLALAVVLAAREKNRVANRILAALIAAVSLMLLLGVAEKLWGFSQAPYLLGLAGPLPFLFWPLLYLYVLALTQPASRPGLRWLAHALPFAASLCWWVPEFFVKPGAEKIALVRAYNAGQIAAPLAMRLVELLLIAQAVAYLAASALALRRYAQRMQGYFSDLSRIDLRWLRAMVLGHAAVWSIVIVSTALRVAGVAPDALRALSQTIQVGSALIIFLTGYISLWQPELREKAEAATKAVPKYQRNRLEEDEAAGLARKVTALMTDRKLYRDATLTLQALADAVGATPHMLSQVLNVHLGKSFFVLVNSYRTEELKAALVESDRGVFELALEAGFNSKSSLNAFFKRHTGVTPTEYRKLHASAKSAQLSHG